MTGIKVFDGKGQRDYMGDGLQATGQTDFSMREIGTYKVNANCTDSIQIKRS